MPMRFYDLWKLEEFGKNIIKRDIDWFDILGDLKNLFPEIYNMLTPELEFPWEWTNDYFREMRRKDAVVRKRSDKVKKSRMWYVRL